MQSVNGSERADTLLLKRIGVEYRDKIGLRLERRSQWSQFDNDKLTVSKRFCIVFSRHLKLDA